MHFEVFPTYILGELTTSERPSFTPSTQSLEIDVDKLNKIKIDSLFSSFGINNCSTQNTDSIFISEDTKFTNINKINESTHFQCRNCEKQKQIDCEICHGQKYITGGNNLVKFIEYVLQFKIGKKKSYINRNSGQKYKYNQTSEKTNIRRSSTANFQSARFSCQSQIRITNKAIIKQKCQKIKNIHQQFNCDECKAFPIIGSRFHCVVCEDFDLCQQCANEVGHPHDLKQYKTSSVHNQMVGILSMLQKLGNREENTKSLVFQKHKYVANSSIR